MFGVFFGFFAVSIGSILLVRVRSYSQNVDGLSTLELTKKIRTIQTHTVLAWSLIIIGMGLLVASG